jgi:predicted transcriptional regulator
MATGPPPGRLGHDWATRAPDPVDTAHTVCKVLSMPRITDDRDRSLSFRLDDDTAAALRQLARANHRSLSGETRAAIAEHLAREHLTRADIERDVLDRTDPGGAVTRG